MVNNVVFASVRTSREAGVARGIDAGTRVLVEDAPGCVLAPGLIFHRVVSNKFQLSEAVEWRVNAGCGVDDKGLVGAGVGQLLRTFVGGKPCVGTAVWYAFPGLVWHRDDAAVRQVRVHRPGVGHVRYAEVGRPC